MTSTSRIVPLGPTELAQYGQARVRDIAFDAVRKLWELRSAQGMKQTELAAVIGKDPAWLSKNLRGPGNWTFRTFGALLAALDGDLEMHVYPSEIPLDRPENYHAYAHFAPPLTSTSNTYSVAKFQAGSFTRAETNASENTISLR